MWLAERFLWRYLAADRLRTAATVVGVALGVAVVVAVRLANVSALRGFETALDAMSGETSLEVVGSGVGLPEDLVSGLGWLRAYGELSPVVEGEVLAGSELLRVLGVDILRDLPFRRYDLLDIGNTRGRAPTADEFLELLRDSTSVVLTEKFAGPRGLVPGSAVRFTIGDTERTFTVRGLLRNEGPARVLDGNFVLMDIAAAQWALGRTGRLDRLEIRLTDPAAIDAAERDIAAKLPQGASVQRPARRGRQVEHMLAAFHLNLTALSAIALLVGLFLVYNTVSTSVVARRSEIGTLRALGVTRGGVLALVLAEALLLAAPGTVLGILFGRVLALGAVSLTSTTVRTLYVATAAGPVALGWSEIVLALAIGIPLSLAAAALPALEASRVSPLAAIRGADRVDASRRFRWASLVAPLTFLAGAGALARVGPVDGRPLAGYLAALLLVLGAAWLVPAVLFGLGVAGRRIAGRLRPEAWLALENLGGAIPRVSVSVAALAVSLSMMVAIAIMIGSFRETVVYWVDQTLTADLFVGPATRSRGARQSTLSDDVRSAVANHPGVAAVDTFTNRSIPYRDTQVMLGASDFSVALSHGTLLFKAPADGRAAMRAAIGRDAVIVSEAFSIRHAVRIGDRIALDTLYGPRVFSVRAVYYDYSSDRGVVLMDRATFARHFGEIGPTGLTVYLRPEVNAERAREDILAALGPGRHVFIFTNRALRDEVLRIFDSTFAITYALELIAIVVAILGVTGTLLTLILERRRELTMLRLAGAERGQVQRMVVVEAALLGAVSQAVGLVMGGALSLLLIYVINLQSFGWSLQFHLPATFLAQLSAVIVAATALAGLYPARRASALAIEGRLDDE